MQLYMMLLMIDKSRDVYYLGVLRKYDIMIFLPVWIVNTREEVVDA